MQTAAAGTSKLLFRFQQFTHILYDVRRTLTMYRVAKKNCTILPAAIEKYGIVFNVPVCECQKQNKKVLLKTCLVVWTTM